MAALPESPPRAPWPDVKALFDAALEHPAAGRAAFVEAADAPPAVRAEVRSLLAHHDTREADFLAAPQAAAAEPALHAGQRLGAWRIERLIGAGGMGEVYLARRDDGSFEGFAAVKLLKRGMDSAAVLRRFALERRALARLAHPNIARLHDAGLGPQGLPYFVMEHVDGRPIDEAARGLALERRIALVLQLADAVAHAHRNLLVHRDLKPGNVLVDASGQVKLLDFGIAKALDPADTGDAETTVGALRPFTPLYASPEQVRGEPATTATDVYSLGVLLVQVLTGQRPYGRGARTPVEAARCVLEEPATRPSELASTSDVLDARARRRLRGDLDNIALKALAKSPQDRYPGVEAFAADLRAFLDGRPVSARAPSPWYLAGKFVGRHRAGSALAAAALTAVVAAGAIAWQQARRAEARFEDLRRFAHVVLFDYHDLVEPLAGSTPLRQRMVGDGLAYLDRLAADAPRDRALRLEMGTAYRNIGFVQRNGFVRPHLGDTAGALRSYARSIALLEALVDSDAADDLAAYELALTLSARAGVQGQDGDVDAARAQLSRAAAIFASHVERDRPDRRHRLELARTHMRLADVLTRAGEPAEAERWVEAARGVLEGLAALEPAHKELPHVWVWVHNTASVIARLRLDWATVATEQSKARERLLVLLEKEPDNARYLEDLAGVSQWLASAMAGLRDPAAAERWADLAVDQWGRLARSDPEDRTTRNQYLDTLTTAGQAVADAGNPARGAERLEAVGESVAALVRRWPKDADVRSRATAHALALLLARDAAGRAVGWPALEAQGAELLREFPDEPRALTVHALIAYHRARLAAEAALRGRGDRAAATAALDAAVVRLAALRERKALAPSRSAQFVTDGRALLVRLRP